MLIDFKDEDFDSKIKNEDVSVIQFSAAWCGPCKAMAPILDQVKTELGGSVRILKIDVDKNQTVADKFKIRGVPTFILFKNGQIVWRQSGGMDKNTMIHKIKPAI